MNVNQSVCLSFLANVLPAFLKRMQVALALNGGNCHCTPTTKPRGTLKTVGGVVLMGFRLFIEEMPLALRNVCVCAARACVSLKKSRIVPFCGGCFELEGGAPAKKKNSSFPAFLSFLTEAWSPRQRDHSCFLSL